jgi:hypothetical protein
MTFTYDRASEDAETLLISKVRLEIDDTVEGEGVRPNGTNLSDEEIAVLLEREGDDEMRAAAAACELLSRAWSKIASISAGPRREEAGKIAAEFRASAVELRRQHGYGSQGGMMSIGTIRVDGYSDDVASDETDATGGEYDDDFTFIRLD